MIKWFVFILLCWSSNIFNQTEIVGLASPIDLRYGQNVIKVSDYFIHAEVISVSSDVGLPFTLSEDNHTITLDVQNSLPVPISDLEIKTQKQTYHIPVFSPTTQQVQLTIKDNGYQDVKVKGEMSSWNMNKYQFTQDAEGHWVTTMTLDPGIYQYKYVVDGLEISDPMNQDSVSNGFGGYNSLLKVDGVPKSSVPHLTTGSYSDYKIKVRSEPNVDRIYCYCENDRIKTEISNEGVEIKIPMTTRQSDRSTIRCYGSRSGGRSNDLVIPLIDGKVVTSGSQLDRHDYRSQIMYFTLIDRFNNGDVTIDDPIEDDRLKPLTNYMGGDLEGITQKIEDGYFDSLQINSLWLSPVTQNPLEAYQEYIDPQYFYSGYHGYWPISSSRVDHRFGDDESMHRLVKTAHDHDINILLDYVTNHVHEEHPIYQQHPDWVTDLYLQDSSYNLRLWDEQRLTTWFDTFMPSLDFSNEEVIDVQVDSTIFWLQKFGLDGYRHDATKHIPKQFWEALTQQLKEDVILKEGRSIYQIGETYGSRDLIKSYLSSGMLDAQFDFNLYFDAREVFAKDDQSFRRLWSSLEQSLQYYGHHSMMGNITGNHDQARFVSLASGDVRFDEDQKMAGFDREIGVTDTIGYDKHRMLLGFVMSIPGVPVIYYGDEIAMPGAGDPDSRRMMRFDQLSDQETQTKQLTKQLTKLRREEMPLLYGSTDLISVTDKTLVFKRSYFGQSCYILFNKSAEELDINIPNDAGNLTSQLNKAKLTKNRTAVLQPYTFDILTNY